MGDVVTFAVAVPWRDSGCPHRNLAWEWVQARWKSLHPEAELVTGTCAGEWSTSAALNDAISQSEGVVVLTSADCVLDPDIVHAAVAGAVQGDWVLPASELLRPPRSVSESITGQPVSYQLPRHVGGQRQNTQLGWGPVVADRALLDFVGGYDERFIGWGAEDEAFFCAARVLAGPPRRLPGRACLLWHPRGDRRQHPNYQSNLALLARYRAAKTPEAMRALIGERP